MTQIEILGIFVLLFLIYIFSFLGVLNTFAERNVVLSWLPLLILFLPVVNTLYFAIFGIKIILKDKENKENLKKMFGKLSQKK